MSEWKVKTKQERTTVNRLRTIWARNVFVDYIQVRSVPLLGIFDSVTVAEVKSLLT